MRLVSLESFKPDTISIEFLLKNIIYDKDENIDFIDEKLFNIEL